jgi:hypothetical protein
MPRPLAAEELERRDTPAAPFETLPVFPFADQAVLDNVRAIAVHGQLLGRRADAFLKLGDSNTADVEYLAPLGKADYNPVTSGLANYGASLIDTLNTFRAPLGGGVNSFARPTPTAYPGGFLPRLLPHLPGEIAATNAAVALVMVGTNDLGIYGDAAHFAGLLRSAVQTLIAQGVVPILSTIPENLTAGDGFRPGTRTFNQVIADTADQFNLPLWNYWRQLAGMPAVGLGADLIHLSASPFGGGNFIGSELGYGQNIRTLQALFMLDWFRTQVVTPPAFVPPSEWTPLTSDDVVYAVGWDMGQSPVVDVFDAANGTRVNRLNAFEPGFSGGVRVAVADVTGDKVPDVIAVPGLGGGPVVRVFDGTSGAMVSNFYAFESSFRSGLNVSAGDLDGDGIAEIVVGAGNGGAPVVATFRGGDFKETGRFFAYEGSFRGGVNVAVKDSEIVAGAGVGGGPVVKLFTPDGGEVSSFAVYAETVRDGVTVAAGDLDGDGVAELAVAPAAGSPHIQVLDGTTFKQRSSFFAADATSPFGARPAIRGGKLLVGLSPAAVQAFTGLSDTPTLFPVDSGTRGFGVFVG